MSLATTTNTNPSTMNEQRRQQQQQQQQQQHYQRNDNSSVPRIRASYHFQNGDMNSIGIVGAGISGGGGGGNYMNTGRGILYDPTAPTTHTSTPSSSSSNGFYHQQLPSIRRPPPPQQHQQPPLFQPRPYMASQQQPSIVQPPPQYQILQERQQPMLHPQQQQPWLPGNNNSMGGGGSGGGSSSSSSSSSFDPQQESESNEANNTLDTFILSLLKKPQERIFLLKLEKDLEDFINNHQVYRLDLPQMNSYQRLMVHKVAPYFKLSHFAEPVRKSVFLCKNAQTAIPEVGFAKLVEPEEKEESQAAPKFKIMRRATSPNSSNGSRRGSPTGSSAVDRKNMTYEERKAAYEEARARIFKDLEQQSESDNGSDKEVVSTQGEATTSSNGNEA